MSKKQIEGRIVDVISKFREENRIDSGLVAEDTAIEDYFNIIVKKTLGEEYLEEYLEDQSKKKERIKNELTNGSLGVFLLCEYIDERILSHEKKFNMIVSLYQTLSFQQKLVN